MTFISLPKPTDYQSKPLSSTPIDQDTNDRHADTPSAHLTPTSALLHSATHLETTMSLQPMRCKKKALLIGIQHYDSINKQSNDEVAAVEGQLKGPHNDVRDMRQLLLDCYGYKPDDITVLIDDGGDERTKPTQKNLIRCMKDLVADARPGDQFYLHFSGHGTQVPDENGDEEDGSDECILTCDHEIIVDDTLNEILVANLPFGSTFVSTFDSCHSGTVLDLMHYRCNQVYVPWVDKGVRRTVFIRNIVARQETQISEILDNSSSVQIPVIQISQQSTAPESLGQPEQRVMVPLSLPRPTRHPALAITTPSSTRRWIDNAVTPTEYSKSPLSLYCTGLCHEESERDVERKADVVSISASRDYQLSWENSHGSSMTEALIKVLRKNPHSSLKDIMLSISHELHDFYLLLHETSRGYKDALNKINIKRAKRGKTLLKGRPVEMDNFQHPEPFAIGYESTMAAKALAVNSRVPIEANALKFL